MVHDDLAAPGAEGLEIGVVGAEVAADAAFDARRITVGVKGLGRHHALQVRPGQHLGDHGTLASQGVGDIQRRRRAIGAARVDAHPRLGPRGAVDPPDAGDLG